MPAFPLAKLFYMALRQAGKPVANFMKRRAKTSVFFRDKVCLPVAQAYHRWDTNVRMTSLGLSKPVKGTIKPLNETLAVDLGAEMIGEMTTFLIGFAVLYLEYWRQSRTVKEKQQQEDNYIKELSDNLTNLNILVERQDAQMREVNRHVIFLQDQMAGIKMSLQDDRKTMKRLVEALFKEEDKVEDMK